MTAPGPARRGRPSVQEAVGRVVAEHDPEGLLAAGAPADEYAPEVQALVGLVVRGPVRAADVLGVWERWFGPGSGLLESPALLDRLTGELAEVRRRCVPGAGPA